MDERQLLRVGRFGHALPQQLSGSLQPVEREVRFGPWLFACGDHRDMGSLHGAMRSRRRADAVCAALGLARDAAEPFQSRRAAP